LVLPADWLLALSWFWFCHSLILSSSLAWSVQRPGLDQSVHARLTLAARLPAQLWLQLLPQATAAFGDK
jgi:hypothetical protein